MKNDKDVTLIHITISGPPNCGKSTILNKIKAMLDSESCCVAVPNKKLRYQVISGDIESNVASNAVVVLHEENLKSEPTKSVKKGTTRLIR